MDIGAANPVAVEVDDAPGEEPARGREALALVPQRERPVDEEGAGRRGRDHDGDHGQPDEREPEDVGRDPVGGGLADPLHEAAGNVVRDVQNTPITAAGARR